MRKHLRKRLRLPLTESVLALCFAVGANAAPPKPAPKSSVRAPAAALDSVLKNAIAAAPPASLWPNNDYARLLDLGDVTVASDGTVTGEYRATIKLFNQRARDLAEVSLPFNSSYQSIKLLKARTIKKDGAIVEVRPEDVRIASPFNDYLMYDDAQSVGFSFPGVEDDCIIDYTWREVTRPLLMPGQFWEYWRFDGLEPVAVSRYTVHAPTDKPLRFKSANNAPAAPEVKTSADGKWKTYVWERRDNKPIASEPAQPNANEIFASVEISSLGDWQSVAHWFDGLARPQEQANDAIRATVAKITAGKTSEEDKARACYNWVANQTRYVGLEFGLSAFRPHAASEVHEKLYGDCKDKAILLISLLNAAGIKAVPVLLKAADATPVESDLPNLNAFDHCIAQAQIDGKTVWLDATAETCAYGDIPESDRGAQAFVVKDGKGEFQIIPPYLPEENGAIVTSHVNLKPDGGAEAAIEVTLRGEAAQGMRAAVRSVTPDKRRDMMRQIAKRFAADGTLKEYTLPDADDKSGPYVLKFTLSAPEYASASGNLLLTPAAPSVGGTENPFESETRSLPVVQNTTSLTKSETVVTLPAGYALTSVPAPMELSCAFETYRSSVTPSADGKTVTISESLESKSARVAPKDYPALRSFYTHLAKISRNKLVLQTK